MADKDDPILAELKAFLGVGNVAKMAAKSSWEWFTGKAKEVMNGNKIMNANPSRLTPRLGESSIGKMVMFFYDPTTKSKLKYYDRYPLIFQIGVYPDGFLGLNLHYLRPIDRAKLLLAIYQTRTKSTTKEIQLKLTYEILKSVAESQLYKPCVKRYLLKGKNEGNGVVGRLMVIEPKDWVKTLALPIERFERGGRNGGQIGAAVDKNEVWNDSNRIAKAAKKKNKPQPKKKKK